MGAIMENGDEWVVEPEPIIAPVVQPNDVPEEVPVTAEREPIGVA